MTTLRHPDDCSHRVPFRARCIGVTAHIAARDPSYARAPRFKARQRRDWLRSMGDVLLIGRDLLFALWAIAVFAFWLAIIAALVL